MDRLDMDASGGDRSLWQRIKDVALTDVGTLVKGVDEEGIAHLEQVLLEADFGVDAALELTDELERGARRGELSSGEDLRRHLRARILEILEDAGQGAGEIHRVDRGPTVVLVLGVNGTGKTTTVAKLARRYARGPGDAVLAATDTFRAGAQRQLETWADRVEARFVGGQEGGDPAAVAYDAVEAARSHGAGLVLVDTAGRLHTRRDLMEELEKVDRVLGRRVEGAPHERFLVVDATSGQNVVHQAREFGKHLDLTGVVLSKLDSTARGGAAVAVARELGLPVRFVGTGETPDDLEPFDPQRYVEAILETGGP